MSLFAASSPAVSLVLEKLEGVKGAGEGKWMALCPAHDDRKHSLSIRVGKEGRAVMHCHAGCSVVAVVTALGLTMTDLFADTEPRGNGAAPVVAKAQGVTTRAKLIKTYDYYDADGNALFQACRFEPKDFRQRRRNGNGEWIWNLDGVTPVLYRLPEIIEAVAMGRQVIVVEGEKDADTLVALGYEATTSPMGAGKWRDDYGAVLAGADVVILPDNDEVGHAHARTIADSLAARDCTVRVVPLPGLALKADVSDWFAKGGTVPQLEQLVARTVPWSIGDAIAAPLGPPRFRLYSIADLEALPPMEWLVGEELAGILPANATFAVFGAPGAGKSFIAADIACSIACRSAERVPDWFGNTVRHGPVLYVAAEGGRGFRHRVIAWRTRHTVARDDLQLSFVLEPVNLYGPDDITHILRTADLLAKQCAAPLELVVFDTVARSMVAGDENSAQDMGLVIDRSDRIKRETGASVGLVHHARKDGDVERGSGALRGGVDTLCLVREDEDGGRILSCEKQKDGDEFEPITFYLTPVGDSCVITAQAPTISAYALTSNQRAALKVLADVFVRGATASEWRGGSGIAERTFYRVRAWLVSQGYVTETTRGNSVRYTVAPSGHWALNGMPGAAQPLLV